MKIYTKTGDKGETGLFNGQRVSKSGLRVDTYGTVDELNSVIGLSLAFNVPSPVKEHLIQINNFLFILGSDLATPLEPPVKFHVQRIGIEHIEILENWIDEYVNELPELKNFILPGGTKPAAYLHHARTVCRRAERKAVNLSDSEVISEESIKFLNRLSDYFFVAARMANFKEGISDNKWEPKK